MPSKLGVNFCDKIWHEKKSLLYVKWANRWWNLNYKTLAMSQSYKLITLVSTFLNICMVCFIYSW
jgi:hypothetical protein